MMIKPPSQTIRSRIFEINNRILIAVKHLQVEERTRTVQKAPVLDLGVRTNSFLVKAGEGSGRGDSIETMAMVKQAKFHLMLF
jgi:hypothetical protein